MIFEDHNTIKTKFTRIFLLLFSVFSAINQRMRNRSISKADCLIPLNKKNPSLIKGSRHAEAQEKKMPTVNIISLKFLIFALDVEPLSDHFLGPGKLYPTKQKTN